MKRFTGIWSVLFALAVNAGIAALLFLLFPAEVREKVLRTVEVSISDYRLPEMEEEPPYEPSLNESDKESGGAENAAASAIGKGTSSDGTGSGGGGTSSERLLNEAMTSFSPDLMPHAVKSGPSTIESKLAVNEIMRDMEFLDGANSIVAPMAADSKSSLPPGHAVSASFKGRMGKAGRSAALKRHGGDLKTEDAVEKALKYLASKQNKNGSWGSAESFQTGDAAALSGFAVLAFLSHGETYTSPSYGETVRKGVGFLRELSAVKGIESAGRGFGHAILTYALAEAFAMTGDLTLKKPLEERVRSIFMHQNKYGSFAENYDNKPADTPPPAEINDPRWKEIIIGEPVCDLSLLAWHVQALTAAQNAGIYVESQTETMDKALEALVRIHQAKKGGFSGGINMRRYDSNPSLNPVGLLCLQFLNAGKSSAARRTARLVLPDKKDVLPKWKDAGGFSLYRWYYQTQCIFQNENGRSRIWEIWNENMKKEMLSNQQKSGAWILPAGDTSFILRNKDDLSIYATSISALILQVYYRYLPTYSIAEASKTEASLADQLEKGIGGFIRRLPGGVDPLADLILGTGAQTMKPVQFGAFNNEVKSIDTPHIPEYFRIYSSFKSTIGVHDKKDWPQTLQPKQRIAVFLDDFLPEGFHGNLMFTTALINGPNKNLTTPSIEYVLNGKSIYHSYHQAQKNMIQFLIPRKFLEPNGNILQIRNTSDIVFVFDGAELKEASMFGPRIYLGSDELESLPDDIRNCFNISYIPVRRDNGNPENIDARIRNARINGANSLLSIEKEDAKSFLNRKYSSDILLELEASEEEDNEYLTSENFEKKGKVIYKNNSATDKKKGAKSFRLSSYDEARQLLHALTGPYSTDEEYWAVWGSFGTEEHGNNFQKYYLTKTAREIVDWLSSGGTGVILTSIVTGGKFYDTVFKTPYPAAAALKQVSKLFDGNPRKLPCVIYPVYGEKPLLFTKIAAAANSPGTITIAVAKRFFTEETATLHTLVPWNGKTKMVIERGFFDAKSPYAEQYGTLEQEESEIMIENNTFEYTSVFPEMTVIRLSQSFASAPRKTVSRPNISHTLKYIPVSIDAAHPELPDGYDFISLRKPRGFASVYGNKASFSILPASEDTRKHHPFRPAEDESLEVSFVTGNKTDRYDSVFLVLGNGGENVEMLTFMIYPKCTLTKKGDTVKSIPFTFSFSGKVFRTSFQGNKWERIIIPFSSEIKPPNWSYLRIIEPRNILDGRMSNISYEINHVGVLKKKKKGEKK